MNQLCSPKQAQVYGFEHLYPSFLALHSRQRMFAYGTANTSALPSQALIQKLDQVPASDVLRQRQSESMHHTLKYMFFEALSILTLTLKTKDVELYQHSLRVQRFAHLLTQALYLPQEERMTIELGALFHDIGKIGISDEVLRKTSRLTSQEFEHMKEHCIRGALMLNQINGLKEVAVLVYHHHERWDGRGYPDGLMGEIIPPGARIVAIADAFEVMTSNRVYQAARTRAQAVEELYRCAGTQFDPALVDLFCTALDSSAFVIEEAAEQEPPPEHLIQRVS